LLRSYTVNTQDSHSVAYVDSLNFERSHDSGIAEIVNGLSLTSTVFSACVGILRKIVYPQIANLVNCTYAKDGLF
jgi:hypothetical protein